jgi:hypothetical protein
VPYTTKPEPLSGPRTTKPVPPKPMQRCEIVISFPESQPDNPELYLSSAACGASPEIAISMVLAHLIKGWSLVQSQR